VAPSFLKLADSHDIENYIIGEIPEARSGTFTSGRIVRGPAFARCNTHKDTKDDEDAEPMAKKVEFVGARAILKSVTS
jgi:hypothetical protein